MRAYTTTGIQMQDSGGTAITDSIGLVSTTQFKQSAVDITDQTIVGTAWEALANGTVTLTLTRNAVIAFSFFGYGSVSASSVAEYQMYHGVTTYTTPLIFTNQINETKSMSGFIAPLTAGVSSLSLKARVASGGGTVTFPNGALSVMIFGK